MKRVFVLLAALSLAACGVDGEPVQPTVETSVGVTSDGVRADTGITLRTGPVSVGWGIGL